MSSQPPVTSMALPKLEPLDDDASRLSNGFMVDANHRSVHNEDQTYSDDEEEQDPNIFADSQLGNMLEPVNRTSTDIKRSDSPGAKGKDPFPELPPESKLERVESEEPLDDFGVPNPTQRLRQILDGILLPSLDSVLKRKAEEEIADLAKVLLLKDPKIKKNVAALLPRTLKDRLKPIGLDIQDQFFTIDQITRETMVTRFFMSSVYGGNMQATCPRPSKAFVDKHGMDDFMFLPTEYQPEAPQVPGAPGLWFCVEPGDDFRIIMRVFVKIEPIAGSKTSRYQFQGMYEVKTANPLTVREWSDQPPRFHNKWAQGIVKMGWGAVVCSRILLRRELDREPKIAEIKDAVLSGRYKTITAEDVKEAYFRGEERMGVWTMKCVGYDNRFQQELHNTFPTWTPPPPKSGKKAATQTRSRVTRTAVDVAEKPKRRTRTVKRKRDVESIFDSDTESEDNTMRVVGDETLNADEDAPMVKRGKWDPDIIELTDDEEPIKYRNSGTKTRPIFI